MAILLPITEADLAGFCARHGVRRLSLFGSTLKGTTHAQSDVDLLVEFVADATPSMLDLSRMEAELSVMLGGKKVDLRTPGDLSKYFRDQVLREAEVQYVAE
jgi:predicted nucleotidyltransferase